MIIVFCEECGNKNSITESQIEDSKARFICTACDYQNKITVTTHQSDQASSIELGELLNSTPDIIGYYIYDCKNGIMINKMPSSLQGSDLKLLGKLLSESYNACSSRFYDTSLMTIVIDQKNLIVKMVDRQLALIIATKNYPLSPAIEKLINNTDLKELVV